MAPSTATRIRDQLVSAAITAVVTLVLTFWAGAWRGKESVDAHNADINAILDVLCEIRPQARACTRLGHTAGEVAQR